MSELSQYFAQNKFCILVEYLASTRIFPVRTSLADFPTMMTLADRVHSDDDLVPLEAAKLYSQHSEKVLHYAGKGRDIAEFELFLKKAKLQNIQNVLLLSGDKLKQHQSGTHYTERTRYLESVNAVMVAKQQGGFCIGVAFNPFKYTEAERDAQYLKLHKKIKAGADFIITQLGYDLASLKQAKQFLNQNHYSQKMLACVMPLSLARAKFMLKQKVAGIVITPHMLQVLEKEKQIGLTDRVYRRCALQILLCKRLGFSGVHLSACYQPEEQLKLEQYIHEYQHLDFQACEKLWNDLWEVTTGKEFEPALVYFSKPARSTEILKYQHLHFLHETLFNSRFGRGIGQFIFDHQFWNKKIAIQSLLKTELMSKHRIVGCESCGQCRLGETLYICPETCPKGLANGPCGGTTLDQCEFGDRECIHSVKARLAKAVQQIDILKDELIPTVPIEMRGTSSWKNWYIHQS